MHSVCADHMQTDKIQRPTREIRKDKPTMSCVLYDRASYLLWLVIRSSAYAVEFFWCVLPMQFAFITYVGFYVLCLLLGDSHTCPVEPIGTQITTNVEPVAKQNNLYLHLFTDWQPGGADVTNLSWGVQKVNPERLQEESSLSVSHRKKYYKYGACQTWAGTWLCVYYVNEPACQPKQGTATRFRISRVKRNTIQMIHVVVIVVVYSRFFSFYFVCF